MAAHHAASDTWSTCALPLDTSFVATLRAQLGASTQGTPMFPPQRVTWAGHEHG